MATTQDNAGSINGVVIRVTALNADKTPVQGPQGAYVTKAFINFKITPEYEAGTDIVQKGADGQACVTYKTADTLKRVNLSVAICDPDPEFTAIISGGTLLADAGQTKGWMAPVTGTNPTPNGVGLEVWSRAVVSGSNASTDPYWHWLVPYAEMRQTGDRVIQEGLLATDFSGWGQGNASFASVGAPIWPYATDRAYAYARSATVPTQTGFVDTTTIPVP